MRRRLILIMAIAVAVLLAGTGALLAYDSSQRNMIANGITIGGVDVGGMTAAQARGRLAGEFGARMRRPIVVRFHGQQRFVLTARAAHLRLDVEGAIQQALQRSRDGWIVGRAFRSLTGGRVNAQLDPGVTFSEPAVRRTVMHAAQILDHPARDASISYSGHSIGLVHDRPGLRVRTGALFAALRDALTNPTASRQITIRARSARPAVTVRELAAKYPTIITVDRSGFALRLWKHLKLVKTYPIAVGMVGLETPAGLYHIQDKQVDPSWYVPKSAWAGSLAGTVVPPGPADPLKARWMGIFNGAGIHGIDPSEYGTIGHNASHGCVRMTIPDVIDLYNRTPVGAPVYIA